MEMNKVAGKNVLFSYPNVSEEFIIHTDYINTQLGGVIIQNGKPIDFYSRKFTPAQINYTSTETEL